MAYLLERRTALRTRRSVAESRRSSWRRPRRCARSARQRGTGRARRNRCAAAAPIEMKRRSMLCQSVSRVPLPASGSSSQRMSCPPQLYSSSLGASACFTRVSVTCGVGVPTVESVAVPTAARFRSASNGAHSRRCSGSVSAFQTFAGGCGARGRARASTSPHPFEPRRRCGARRVLFTAGHVVSFPSQMRPVPFAPGAAPAHRRAVTRRGGTEPATHRLPAAVWD